MKRQAATGHRPVNRIFAAAGMFLFGLSAAALAQTGGGTSDAAGTSIGTQATGTAGAMPATTPGSVPGGAVPYQTTTPRVPSTAPVPAPTAPMTAPGMPGNAMAPGTMTGTAGTASCATPGACASPQPGSTMATPPETSYPLQPPGNTNPR